MASPVYAGICSSSLTCLCLFASPTSPSLTHSMQVLAHKCVTDIGQPDLLAVIYFLLLQVCGWLHAFTPSFSHAADHLLFLRDS